MIHICHPLTTTSNNSNTSKTSQNSLQIITWSSRRHRKQQQWRLQKQGFAFSTPRMAHQTSPSTPSWVHEDCRWRPGKIWNPRHLRKVEKSANGKWKKLTSWFIPWNWQIYSMGIWLQITGSAQYVVVLISMRLTKSELVELNILLNKNTSHPRSHPVHNQETLRQEPFHAKASIARISKLRLLGVDDVEKSSGRMG